MKRLLLCIFTVLLLMILAFNIFLLVARTRNVEIFGGSVLLAEGDSWELEIEEDESISLSDESVLFVEEWISREDGEKICVLRATANGYCTVRVLDEHGSASVKTYYDVVVQPVLDDNSVISLRCLEDGSVAKCLENKLQLAFGCEYEILVDGKKLVAQGLLPCYDVSIADRSTHGRQNLHFREDGSFTVSGMRGGSICLSSGFFEEIGVAYEVTDGFFSSEFFLNSYLDSFGDNLRREELTLAHLSNISTLKTTDLSLFEGVSDQYLQTVFPNLRELSVLLETSENDWGIVRVPKQIERILLMTADTESISVRASFQGERQASRLEFFVDGIVNFYPAIKEEQATPNFSEFLELKMDFSASGVENRHWGGLSSSINISSQNSVCAVPAFCDIGTLSLSVHTPTAIIGCDGLHQGETGADAIKVPDGDLHIKNKCALWIWGGDGIDGNSGTDGADGDNSSRNGTPGSHGADGTNGGNAVTVKTLRVDSDQFRYPVIMIGGDGGNGGNGGDGGDGLAGMKCRNSKCDGTDGGDGGNGGDGGVGGYALNAIEVYADSRSLCITNGYGGSSGLFGNAGDGKKCKGFLSLSIGTHKGKDGNKGESGESGLNHGALIGGRRYTLSDADFIDLDHGGITVQTFLFVDDSEPVAGSSYYLDSDSVKALNTWLLRVSEIEDTGDAVENILSWLRYDVFSDKYLGEWYLRCLCEDRKISYIHTPWEP